MTERKLNDGVDWLLLVTPMAIGCLTSHIHITYLPMYSDKPYRYLATTYSTYVRVVIINVEHNILCIIMKNIHKFQYVCTFIYTQTLQS